MMAAGDQPEEIEFERARGAPTNRDMARGLGGTLLARLSAVIDLVAQPIYIALFGLPSYGLYAVLWSAVNLAENVADLGMTSTLQKTVPQAADEREAVAALRSALLIGLLPCLVVAALVSAFAPAVAPIFNVAAEDRDTLVGAIRLFAWALPVWAFVEIATSALRARRAFGPEIRLRVFWEQVIRLALALLFYLFEQSIMALLAAHLVSLIATALLSARLLGRYYQLQYLFRPAERPIAGKTLAVGLSVLPANVITRLFSDGPPLVLNAYLPGAQGATAAGLFTIVRKLASVVFLVRGGFVYVLSPLASAAHQGRDEVRRLYSFASRLAIVLVLPLGATLAAGSAIVLEIFGSPAARAAAPALVVLVLARMFDAVVGLASSILLVLGGYSQRLLGSFAALVTAIVVGWATVPAYEVAGAALAVGAGLIVEGIITNVQLHRRQRINPYDERFRTAALKAALVAIGIALAAAASDYAPALAKPVLLVVILASGIWLSARLALSRDDKRALGKAARKLRLIPAGDLA